MASTVTPLHCGTVHLDKSILTDGVDRGQVIPAPSMAFLIQGPDTILVDTSFGDPERMSTLHYPCDRDDDQTLAAGLGRHGLAVDDIDTVVLTHLHWDHCYNLDRFEHADILVSRTELAYAIAPYDMHAVPYESKAIGRTPPWLSVALEPIEGETQIGADVTAFPTPGHAVGHQSIAVETEVGTVVVAGDAIPTFENLEGTAHAAYVPGTNVDTFAWWHSAQKIERRADVILPGHEPAILEEGTVG